MRQLMRMRSRGGRDRVRISFMGMMARMRSNAIITPEREIQDLQLLLLRYLR